MLTVAKIMGTTWDDIDSELVEDLLGVLTELNVDENDAIEAIWCNTEGSLHEMRLPEIWIEGLGTAIVERVAELIRENREEYVEYTLDKLDIPYDTILAAEMEADLVSGLSLVDIFTGNRVQYDGTPWERDIIFNNDLDQYPLNTIDMLTPREIVAKWFIEIGLRDNYSTN